ncbi:MAG: hypothetical protein JNM88_17855 [Chitinophagaceae bacterium]|nr:hypothetical protein [Chitinophagaceae bacterium]
MKLLSILALFSVLGISSCSKRDCGCVTPPVTEANWKITRIFGGFGGTEKELTDDQKNSILTTNSLGAFTCRNTVTGQVTTGTIRTETVDNNLTLVTFNPLLPVYPVANFWLLEKTNDTMVVSDRNADGYTITFTRQ